MTLTADALWLNSFFSGYDTDILSFAHRLAEIAGSVLTPFNRIITLLGEKGLLFLLLALVFMLFPRWRRTGVCIFGAVCCGALITNIILKDLIARPRPYDFDATMREWWVFAGSHFESDYCFPSGHMNAACAFTSGFVFTRGKKWLPWGLLYVVLMGISRNFLIVHYPSDIVGGFIFGTCAGLISWLIIKAVYKKWGQSKLLREE